jgi:predicted metal-dependent phosphoesterase TrpH
LNTIDLHMHTCYSDGKYTPSELLLKASGIGLKTVAITDHDNANGARKAVSITKTMGMELVPGIELTTTWSNLGLPPGETDVDLLGYFIDLDSPDLRAMEKARTEDVYERMADLCDRLSAAGFPLTLKDIQGVNANYPSIAATIFAMQGKDYAEGWEAGYRLVMESWRKVRPAANAEIGAMIAYIHATGGAAVLAHPAAIASPQGLIGESQVAELADMGLDGLEVYHHRNDEATRQKLLALAQQFDLAVSGGSDEHGWWKSRLGTQPVTREMLEALRKRAKH